MNHEIAETIKNNKDRKKVITLGDSLRNGIKEKVLSKKQNVKVVNKPRATSNFFINMML